MGAHGDWVAVEAGALPTDAASLIRGLVMALGS